MSETVPFTERLRAAAEPPPLREQVKLVVLDHGVIVVRDFADLPAQLAPGDLLVVNDAATWPASLATHTAGGAPVEVRLASGALSGSRTLAVLFGAGDWHTRTEDRPPPPPVAPGDVLALDGTDLAITIVAVRSARVVEVALPALGPLFAIGRPIQYAHVARPLAAWDVWTSYGGRPWAVEMPSAGRPLSFALLRALAARGVEVARLTHAAGLSSTGDAALDATLPWPERYDIPAETAAAIARTRARGGRVVAVGTTVVRALESAARDDGSVRAGEDTATLVIGAGHRLRAVDAILSGLHDPPDSHFRLLEAFAPHIALVAAWARARELGLRGHELGDSLLVLR